MSDTVNLTCAMCKVNPKDHRHAMAGRTLFAAAICTVFFAVIGMTDHTVGGQEAAKEMCDALVQSFHISSISLLPIGLLVLLTFTKLSTLSNLLICSVFSIAIGAVTQRIPVKELLLSGLVGFKTASDAEGVISSLSGGGLVSSVKTLTVIVVTTTLGGILGAAGITTVLFHCIQEKAANHRQLSLICYLLSLGILFISGNQVLAIILMAPEFLKIFEKSRGGKLELAGLFADTTVVAGPLLPWSVLHFFVAQVFSLTNSSYVFYSVFCSITVIIGLVYLLLCNSRSLIGKSPNSVSALE